VGVGWLELQVRAETERHGDVQSDGVYTQTTETLPVPFTQHAVSCDTNGIPYRKINMFVVV